MFVGGQLADRLMSLEKLLALLHPIGGAAMFAWRSRRSFWPFLC